MLEEPTIVLGSPESQPEAILSEHNHTRPL